MSVPYRGRVTGALLSFAWEMEDAWMRSMAKAPRQSAWAARTPKVSEAAVAHTSISRLKRSCMEVWSPREVREV